MKKTAYLKNMLLLLKLRLTKMTSFTMLSFLLFTANAFAQNTVKGKIVNEDGQPVAGASVVLKGTTTGTTTDNSGNFSIVAPKGSVLVITSISYTDQEITVGDNANINIRLTRSSGSLGEVIVVGYGTQRKEAVTGSVASISGLAMREVPSPNISQALQGRIAGVEISQNSTRPGATMQIRVRGTRSLSA
jgi:hypothetical protein